MSAPKHTPGPWRIDSRDGAWDEEKDEWIGDAGDVTRIAGPNGEHVCGTCDGCNKIKLDDAKLIAAAPDHALLLAAIVAGVARWRPFEGNPEGAGEICVGGLAYAADLDESGCPEITDARRAALVQALHAAGRLP